MYRITPVHLTILQRSGAVPDGVSVMAGDCCRFGVEGRAQLDANSPPSAHLLDFLTSCNPYAYELQHQRMSPGRFELYELAT